ncbi:MAG: glycosyltransferase family 39 protein [Planctomycetota bacterium]
MKRRLMSRAWAEWRVYFTPVCVLVGVWLVGADQGWPRVDTGLYAGLSRWAYAGDLAQWWFLTGPEEDYFNKPPLVFWGHGLAMWVWRAVDGEPTMWVLRVPTLIMAVVALVVFTDVVRRVSGARAALTAGIVLATTLEFFRFTKNISLDMWVCGCVLVGVWAAVRAGRGMLNPASREASERAPNVWAWIMVGGVAFGAGLMVKPMLALVPLVLLGVWVGWVRGWRRGLFETIAMLVVALAVALPWHVSMALRYDDFLATYIGGQALDRITTDAHGSQPPYYYLTELVTWYWPWLVPAAIGMVWGMRRLASRSGVARVPLAARPPVPDTDTHPTGGHATSDTHLQRFLGDRAALALALVWTIGWLAALSISTDKATRYAISMYAGLAIIAALWMTKGAPVWVRRGGGRAATVWLGPVALAGGIAAGIVVAVVPVRVHPPMHEGWAALVERIDAEPEMLDELVIAGDWRTAGGTLMWRYGAWPGRVEEDGPTDGMVLDTDGVVDASTGRVRLERHGFRLIETTMR